MRQVRFRVWTLLPAVAVLAGVLRVGYHWTEYKRRAANHRRFEHLYRSKVYCYDSPREDAEKINNELLANADHHARLKEKYEQAARTPWLPVEPDPPPPR